MWIFNRKPRLKPKTEKSFHMKRLRFPDREGEDSTVQIDSKIKLDKFDMEDDDDET